MLLLSWLALGLAGLGLALMSVLLLRLDGPAPLDVTGPARRVLAFTGDPDGLRFERLSLRWSVLRDGPAAPLTIHVHDLSFRAGSTRGTVGNAELAVRWLGLLEGRIEPVSLGAEGARIDIGRAETRPDARPPPPLGALRLLSLEDVTVRWAAAPSPAVTVRVSSARFSRDRHGRFGGSGTASLDGFGEAATLRLAAAPSGPATSLLHAALAPFHPATGPLDATVTLSADVTLGSDATVREAVLGGSVGSGTLSIAGFPVPLEDAEVRMTVRPPMPGRRTEPGWTAALDAAVLHLRPAPGGTADGVPRIEATGTLDGEPWRAGRLSGAVHLTLDRVPAASLATYWPPPIAPGARRWITTNIPTGTVSALALDLVLGSADGLSGLEVGRVGGGFDGAALDVHWLRPIPPITGAAGHVTLVDADTVAIALTDGHQGALTVSGSRMRITGLETPTQIGRIAVRIRGPLTAVLSVLGEKRLRLLSRRPLGFTDPAGTVDGSVDVTLPLDNKVAMEDVGVRASARLRDVHLGDLVAGRGLDDGQFRLEADVDGLSLDGHARLASVTGTLAVRMDFRDGPPAQVVESARVGARADLATLARAGLPIGPYANGVASLDATYALRRDKRADITLGADLAGAALTTPFGWSKPVGPGATVAAALVLEDGRLASIDRLDADGPDLRIRSRPILSGGDVGGLALETLHLGRTDASGRVLFAAGRERALAVTLKGPSLDLAPLLRANEASPPRPSAPDAGPRPRESRPLAWTISVAFDRVFLPGPRSLGAVEARVRGAGRRPIEGSLTASDPSAISARIAPVPGGRTLAIQAGDAGALLGGLAITDEVQGGDLTLEGRFDDAARGDPFTGHVTADRFTLRRVPWIARLLRDLTIYGLFDRAKTPGFAVTRVDAPIRITNEDLILDDARVWQAALGLTATGSVALGSGALDLHGTIVPAYAFNTLPGRLPLVGRLFSPEKGGGVFAATWRVVGSASNPTVSVNPLAALVPGVLRKLIAK